ncbi:MAG: M23 family metallopeptidase [Alphaproteobacteria bacterium]|nr:M23 family metallopeptidase [Alphaproteobacteria bacterium]
MQSAYESRVADLQTSYDELNGALVAAEDRFKANADQLRSQQNIIMKFIAQKNQVDRTLQAFANGSAAKPPPQKPAVAVAAPMPPTIPAGGDDADADSVSQPAVTVAPESLPPPEAPKQTRASFLDLGRAVGRLSGFLFGGQRPSSTAISPEMLVRHPGLKALALETDRVAQIGVSESQLMASTGQRLAERTQSLQDVIRRTGIEPSEYARRFSDTEGVGGPDIPLQAVEIEGIADTTFKNAYFTASSMLEHMENLLSALRHVPLTTPVHGPLFNRTSGFGARIDPFTGRSSFHPGLDFAGPYGSTVTATAPGTVVWAGARGGYGNLVEIDHGFGIRTRYGHLSALLVRPGAVVAQGSPIGRLGSTGRSTGPHVHYEVWYDNIVRNPGNFIEAGRSVLQH